MSFVRVRCPHCDAINDLESDVCIRCGESLKVVSSPELASTPKKGAGGFTVLLLVGSTAAALLGLVTLSEATMGIGVIAFACWLAIMGRISQAGDQYFER